MGKWEMVRLGDVCKFINGDRGVNYPSKKDFIDKGIPFINAGHLESGIVQLEAMNYISKDTFDKLGSGKIQENDLLYCLRGSLGKQAIVKNIKSGAIASSLVILRPEENICIKYISYVLSSNLIARQQAQANTGSSQPNLSAANVKEYRIPLPPLEIQAEIARNLDLASELVKLHKSKLEELDKLIQSVFYDMFGDPVTNEKGWNVEKLGVLASVGSSKRVFTNELVDSGIPFYRGTEVGKLALNQSIAPSLFITEEHYEQLTSSSGKPIIGDLLMPSICDDGRVWRVNTKEPFYFKDGRVLWVNFTDAKSNTIYIQYALKEKLINDYKNIASGTTFAELKIFALKDVDIILPPLPLQQKFANIVTEIETQKVQVQQALDDAQMLYDSLMQEYFE